MCKTPGYCHIYALNQLMFIMEKRLLNTAVVVAALGYCVDIYDLLLFGFVRQKPAVFAVRPALQRLSAVAVAAVGRAGGRH